MPPWRLSLMQKRIIYGLILLAGVVFEQFREADVFGSAQAVYSVWGHEKTWLISHVYFCMEHIKWIVLCVMLMYKNRTEDYAIDSWFMIIGVADFIDYLLFNNEIWFYLGIIPVSFNVVSMAWFSYVAYITYRND